MTRMRNHRVRMLCAMLACFCAGVIAYAGLRLGYAPPNVFRLKPDAEALPPSDFRLDLTTANANVAAPEASHGINGESATGEISHSGLRVPIDGVSMESFKAQFDKSRGNRRHEAVDILAPRGTPVHAATNGTIAKLFTSKPGGITIYQFDFEGDLGYYYAHLDRYETGLHDGQTILQGEVIGYVGTTGNAPPNTPHLHFAIFALDGDRRWWRGRAVDPYLVFKERR